MILPLLQVVGLHCDQSWRFFCTLGNFLKPFATMNLPKSPTFLGNFSKGAKIIHFSNEIIFGNFYRHLAIFIWSYCRACPFLTQDYNLDATTL